MLSTKNDILLIEDNDLDAYIAEQMLTVLDDSCRIIRFTNGYSAMQYLIDIDQDPPPLILLDLNLPIMTGSEFLAKIRKIPKFKDIKVSVLTSSFDPTDLEFCKKQGIQKYYQKPLDQKMTEEILGLTY